MKKTSLLYLGILIILAAISYGFSQDTIQREREILNRNIQLYKTGMYEKAEQNFALIVSRLPNSIFVTTNYLMLAKSQYKNQDYMAAINTAKDFLNSYPESNYSDDMYYVMANSYYRLNRPSTAILNWEKALNITHEEKMIERSSELISRTVHFVLAQREIESLSTQLSSADGHMLLGIGQAEKHIDNDAAFLATETLEQVIKSYPQSRFTSQAKNLLNMGSTKAAGKSAVGLLLPLSGYNQELGLELKEGAEFALEEFNQAGPLKIELVIRDYGTEIVRAISYYKELAANRSVLSVMGPVENDISAACIALSAYEKLALISPTATNGDLHNLSNYFFQLNSTIEKRAEYLAKYATDSLKIKRFATFSPIDNHFVQMVDRFSELVLEDSAQIVAQEWYYPGDQDVNKQFMNIKRKGLKLTFMDSLITENPGLDTSLVDSLYRSYQKEQEELLEETQTTIDSADLAVTSIGGLFVPIYREDIKIIAPQIAYSNIQAQFFGNGDWYDLEELKKNKNYINGLIFVSSGYYDEENWDYRQFRNKFRTTMKKTPTVYHMIGYDTMKYLLSPLVNLKSAPGRETYMMNLQQNKSYHGVYRSLEMDDSNCNEDLQLLKYEYGQIIPLK